MSEKVCVFVDGENFRHSIVDLFKGDFDPTDYLPKQADWGRFFDNLVEKTGSHGDVQRLRTYWYVVQHVDFQPYKLPDLSALQAPGP